LKRGRKREGRKREKKKKRNRVSAMVEQQRRCLSSHFLSASPLFPLLDRVDCPQFPRQGLSRSASSQPQQKRPQKEEKTREKRPREKRTRWPLQDRKKRKDKKLNPLTAVSSEAILAPLGSVVSCVAGAGVEDDDAGVGRTSPGRGSVMGTPEEKKREAEAAAAIGATPTTAEEEDDDDATELLANADAAARPARGSRPESSEAALEDETMFFL
jgi:hypothetical protein